MNSTFKGILIGVSASALILAVAEILLNSEGQPNVRTSTNSNNETSVKPPTQNSEYLDKQLNANTQVKKLDNSSEAINQAIH